MDRDSAIKKRGKIYGIDIIRILACVSVYTHHYLRMELEPAMDGFNAFRSSSLFRYLLGVFGAEYAVIAFFVIAGFFMSYNTRTESLRPLEYGKKCAYKCMNILIPSFLVITATALIALPLKIAGMADIFSIRDYFLDLFKLTVGIQGDKHIHYAYPLWFQHFIFMGYISGYIFLYVFRKDRRIRLAAYFPALIYLLFNSEYTFMVFMGMLAGELCAGEYEKRLRKIFGNVFLNILFMIMLSSGMSMVIRENYDSPQIYGPATLLFVLLLLTVYCMSKAEEGKKYKIIDFLSSNSYSCYLIHFFLMCSLMRIVYRIFRHTSLPGRNNTLFCAVMYIIMTISLWILGYIFNKYVLKPLKRSYDRIWSETEVRLTR